jgi:hypothetical protein
MTQLADRLQGQVYLCDLSVLQVGVLCSQGWNPVPCNVNSKYFYIPAEPNFLADVGEAQKGRVFRGINGFTKAVYFPRLGSYSASPLLSHLVALLLNLRKYI